MAEEKIIAVDGGTVEEEDKSKVDQELDRSRGDSDDVSGGSLSEGDDNGQRQGSDNDQKLRKGRRQRRLKGGKRHNRKHHPYAGMSYSDRMAMKLGSSGEYPHAPRNTTQYLIEDHVKSNISPDLSNRASPASNCDETMTDACRTMALEVEESESKEERPQDSPHLSLPFTASERLQYDQEFVAVYDNVNEDRLLKMTKEELVKMTSRLLQTVDGGRRKKDIGHKKEETERLRESPNTNPLSSCN